MSSNSLTSLLQFYYNDILLFVPGESRKAFNDFKKKKKKDTVKNRNKLKPAKRSGKGKTDIEKYQ